MNILFCVAKRDQRHQTVNPCPEDVHSSSCLLGSFPPTGNVLTCLNQQSLFDFVWGVTPHASHRGKKRYRDNQFSYVTVTINWSNNQRYLQYLCQYYLTKPSCLESVAVKDELSIKAFPKSFCFAALCLSAAKADILKALLTSLRSKFCLINITLLTSLQGSSWTLQAEQMDGDLVRNLTKAFYFIS